MGNDMTRDATYVTPNDNSVPTKKKKTRRRLSAVLGKAQPKKRIRRKSNNPPSAYALFIRDVRNQLFERRVSFRELSANCSAKWRQMSAEEKQKYHLMAKKIREDMIRIGGRAQRRNKTDAKDRKKGPFWNYAQKFRTAVREQLEREMGRKPQMKDVNRQIGYNWQQLSAEDKKLYQNV